MTLSGCLINNQSINILIICCAVILRLFIILRFVIKMHSLKFENMKRLEEAKRLAEIESGWQKTYADLMAK